MIGKQLKNYKLLEIIGKGGMSVVYLARDINTGKLSAVKVLKKQFTEENDHIERFFTRQIKLTKDLKHPNVVKLIDYGKINDTYFLVYELIQGLSLDAYLKKNKPTVSQIESISLSILNGLSYAHNMGLVHRDIKPQNILITKDGKVKITDFGIARALSSSTVTQTGMFIGSPGYVSPEQADGKKVEPSSDLYSFGILLFEMLSKRLPFTSDTPWGIVNKHINEAPPDISKIVKDIPPYLSYIVAKCLVKRPSGRFSSADEIIRVVKNKSFTSETVIKNLRIDEPKKNYHVAPPPKMKSSNMKKVWIAIGSVVGFIIIISIIVSVAGRANREVVSNYGEEEATVEEVVETVEEAVEEEALAEEEKEEEEKPVPQGPSKSTYFANVRNIINEYDMLINHWNTYIGNYTDINAVIEFGGSIQNKLGEINNMLKSITPASGYEGAQVHFIDLANNMYHYQQQEINCLKNNDIDGWKNMISNFNNTHSEFIDYYNSFQ